MPVSRFVELLDEVSALPRGGQGKFTLDELKNNLQLRASIAAKINKAYEAGELTAEQRDQLVQLNRRSTLGA